MCQSALRDEWREVEPVTVWWAFRSSATPALLSLLNPTERARHARYLREEDRARFLMGVVTTRLALAELLGTAPEHVPLTRTCPDCDEPHGPPRLPDGPHLSVSHSGDLVAVAISPHGPLGVDVEQSTRRLGLDVTPHVLSEDEHAPTEQALLTYWVRKEALLKATGDGLRVPMTDLHVSPPDAPPRLLAWKKRPDLPSRFTLRTLTPDDTHPAALALLDHPGTAPLRERPTTDLL